MFQQAIPRSFVWLLGLYAVLIIGITGCGDDDNEWVGAWTLESIDGENIRAQIEAIEWLLNAYEGEETDLSYDDEWTFDNDETWHAEITTAVETAGDRGAQTTEVSGTYSLSDSNYTLTINDVTATISGESDILGDTGSGTPFESGSTETGTWSREGNTLTLDSNTDETIVFKKK